MSRICQLTGKKSLVGNHVSHSNRKTKRRFNVNLKTKRFFVPELNLWVTLKVSTQAIRTMNKLGIYNFLKNQLQKGFDPFIWVVDPQAEKTLSIERKYRRVESVDSNGNKTYSITFTAEAFDNNKKVKLSSIFK
jgi:large subunit ribosomal protein L28